MHQVWWSTFQVLHSKQIKKVPNGQKGLNVTLFAAAST